MYEARSLAAQGRPAKKEGLMEVFRVVLYFFAAFSLIYFFYNVSWVTRPGTSRFSVSCGLSNPVYYPYAGIYWQAGCAPDGPVVWFD